MNPTFDIIPDIHGQYEKLVDLISKLGWFEMQGSWKHRDKGRKIIFLGDFIDRGKQNLKVVSLIRNLQSEELAYAIIGNHELNAIYFHSQNPMTGHPLRAHSPANIQQHKSFLNEFPLKNSETEDIINWFCSLPLFLDFSSFRVVHACWTSSAIGTLSKINKLGIFPREFYIENNLKKSKAYFAIELLTKGPEARLPVNTLFTDKTGIQRRALRLAWWRDKAKSWRDLAVSVPNTSLIPDSTFNNWDEIELYPKNAPPVFFGHYWMDSPLRVERQNALCLDYSAGANGPLVSYHFNPLLPDLALKNITTNSI